MSEDHVLVLVDEVHDDPVDSLPDDGDVGEVACHALDEVEFGESEHVRLPVRGENVLKHLLGAVVVVAEHEVSLLEVPAQPRHPREDGFQLGVVGDVARLAEAALGVEIP